MKFFLFNINFEDMTFKGIIQAILPEKSGVSKTSGKEWRTQEFVVRNDEGKYPDIMVFSVFNKDIGAQQGDEVEVKFDGNAREWQGKWFNDLRAYDVTVLTPLAQAPRVETTVAPQPQQKEQPSLFPQQKEDELPF